GAVREVCAVTSSREDPAHRVGTLCGGTPQAARAWQAGDLQLPGLHLHLRQDSSGQIPDQKEDPAGPHAGEAQDDQRGDVATHASADPRAREVAGTGRQRLLRLPCGADQRPRTGGVRGPRHRPFAAYADAAEAKRTGTGGNEGAAGEQPASETDHPPSLAERSLCRHTPEVGAVCGKAARTVLCGGRAMKSASLPLLGWMAPLRHLSAKLLSDRISSEWEPSMGEVTTIGLDLAKHVFQVHGVDAEGATVLRKQLRRAQVLAFFSRLPPCLLGLEACATAHYWARELRALGHEVRLMPAQYVKAYIKRNKHDAADAE